MKHAFSFLILLVLISACAPVKTEKQEPLALRPAGFSDLKGWKNDDFTGFDQAFKRSCGRIKGRSGNALLGPMKQAGTNGQWQEICRDFNVLKTPDTSTLRAFFEARLRPYQVLGGNDPKGLFTGYYEASLRGSRSKTARYNIPLYQRPGDLVMVHLGEFRDDLKGVRIAGRVQGGTLKPYESREEIVTGNWPHNDKVLVWVDDAVDAFFVQVQGSGVIQMDDGSVMRIGYAGQNGHVYFAIGRALVHRGELDKDEVSLQSIRAWLEANPDQADDIMNTNKSYVFFRELTGAGPIGAQGVALTAGRSIAVDRTLHSYGVPIWLDADAPIKGDNSIQRLMVAQDTGGAIQGPVRGDYFWGYGPEAERMAGAMKSEGRYWVLLPK